MSRSSCGCVADAWRDFSAYRSLTWTSAGSSRAWASPCATRRVGGTSPYPTRRVDVLREVDPIEEVARHYGFDRIPVTFPALTTAPPPIDPRITQTRALRSIMTGAGFSEAVTFGFVAEVRGNAVCGRRGSRSDCQPVVGDVRRAAAVDPAGTRRSRRAQPAPRAARRAAVRNRRAVLTRARRATRPGLRLDRFRRWRPLERGTRAVDYFDMQGVVERVCQSLRVDVQMEPRAESWLVPGRGAAILAGGTRIGSLGQLARPSSSSMTCRCRMRSSSPSSIWKRACDRGRPGGRAAASAPVGDARHLDARRRHAAAAAVRRTIREHAPAILVRVNEFDRYQGKGVPDGQVSLSLRLTFRVPIARSLTPRCSPRWTGVAASKTSRRGATLAVPRRLSSTSSGQGSRRQRW